MHEVPFEHERPRLFGLAYRMLGSAHEAEDVVQDTWLRWAGADPASIDNPAAWLTTACTRLCLNRLDSARVRRETYVGPWLPEPIVTTDPAVGPAETAVERDSVALALLVALERLSPPERAVYVLREAFGHPHAEVAAIIDVSEAASRQLHTRARRRIAGTTPGTGTSTVPGPGASATGAVPASGRTSVSTDRGRALIDRFLAAARDGAVRELEALLAADVTSWSDGGGRVNAARRPVHGRETVARYLAGIFARFTDGLASTVVEVNGAPAVVATADDRVVGVLALEAGADGVVGVRFLLNPDKLGFLTAQMSRSGALSGRDS